MKKVIKDTIGWILYIAVLAGLIWGIPRGMSYFLKTPYPMASITSSSMWPALKQGDLVLIKGIQNKNEIQLGDIIVYKNVSLSSGPVTGFTIHRVVQIGQNTVVTKGDANNVSDPPVQYEEVIGKTLTINQKPIRIPMLGNVSIFINKGSL